MINYSLERIAEIVDGQLFGNPALTVNGLEIDSRLIRENQLFAPIKGQRVNGHDFVRDLPQKGVRASFWLKGEAGMPDNVSCIVVDNVEDALIKLSTYYRQQFKGKVIGVTGSSGKTSTKDMLYSILKSRYQVSKTLGNQNNEIGIPRTLLSAAEDDDFVVVEMGIDHINEMTGYAEMARPDIAVIVSIAPAHLLNFLTIDNVVKEKCRIVDHSAAVQCYYYDDAYGLRKELEAKNLLIKPVSYGFSENADVVIDSYSITLQGSRFSLNIFPGKIFETKLLGKQLIANLSAAIAIARDQGMTFEEIQMALNDLSITEHRLQLKKIGQAAVIDDAYNSNPLSLKASLELLQSLPDNIEKIACLGDMLELGSDCRELHREIGDVIDFKQFAMTLLYGSEMEALAEKLQGQSVAVRHFKDYEKYYVELEKYILPDHVLLLKASNGMNFIELVRRLEEHYEN